MKPKVAFFIIMKNVVYLSVGFYGIRPNIERYLKGDFLDGTWKVGRY